MSAASVWITSSITRPAAPLRAGSDRPSALTTPAVTEPARPSGLPTATTSWPTTQAVGVAELRPGRGGAPGRAATARSDSGSAPTTSNGRLGAVGERGRARAGRRHDVGVGEQEPSSVNTTADPAPPRPGRCARTVTARDVRGQLAGDPR